MRVFERRPVFFCLFAPQNSPSVLRIHAALRADNCGASQKTAPKVRLHQVSMRVSGRNNCGAGESVATLIYNKTSFEY